MKKYCIDCNKEISRFAKRCRRCANKEENNPAFKDGKYVNNKFCKICHIAINYRATFCKKCYLEKRKGKNHPNYKNGLPFCIDCGKQVTGHKVIRCRKCYIKFNHGKNHHAYKVKPKCIDCGKLLSANYYKRCKSCAQKIKYPDSTLHPAYKHGMSKYSYPSDFNKSLKTKIRKRDKQICQNCRIIEKEHLAVFGRVLDVHHIDYNKFNLKKINLITLCRRCNIRANTNRDYWYAYYKYMTENKEFNYD